MRTRPIETVRRARPSTSMTEHCPVLPRCMLYETACSSPVSGSRLRCAVYPPVSVPPKSHTPSVSNSSVSLDPQQDDFARVTGITAASRDSRVQQIDRHPAGGACRVAVERGLAHRHIEPRGQQPQVRRVRDLANQRRVEIGHGTPSGRPASRGDEHRGLHQRLGAEAIHGAHTVHSTLSSLFESGAEALLLLKLPM
jgi:hypothetical protein